MKKSSLLIVIVLLLGFTKSYTQSTGSIMIGGGLDLLKSDNNKIADKAQVGFEVNYFLLRNYSVTGGLEIWTQGNESLILGMRWYPVENIFARFRGLIGNKSEVSLGAGYWTAPHPEIEFEFEFECGCEFGCEFECGCEFEFECGFGLESGYIHLI